jgi:plastocyanin
MPVAAGTTTLPTFTVTVNSTDPLWFYCAQGAGTPNSHCGAGMVFAINCGADGADNSFANFKKAALGTRNSTSSSVTIPPAPTPSLVTQVVTLGSEIWTTTYSSYPNSPGPTPASSGGDVHRIVVGGPGKLLYEPSHIAAKPRDVVVFEFRQKNHTVTQSSFEDPCKRLNATDVTPLDSGFMPVADGATTFPTYNFTVRDTAPIWAYCRQVNHCVAGMVFAINSDESGPRNFQAFQDLAKGTGSSSTAGSPSPTSTGTTNGTNTGGASQLKVGFAAMLLPLAFLLAPAL